MIEIGNTLVGNEVIKTEFVCNLSKCKGACCIAGDLGAPLEEEERHTLDDIFPLIRPYLNEKGLKALEEQGAYVLDDQGDYSTPLVDGKECAYVVFEKNGTLKCAIEQAYSDGYKLARLIQCTYTRRLALYTPLVVPSGHRSRDDS